MGVISGAIDDAVDAIKKAQEFIDGATAWINRVIQGALQRLVDEQLKGNLGDLIRDTVIPALSKKLTDMILAFIGYVKKVRNALKIIAKVLGVIGDGIGWIEDTFGEVGLIGFVVAGPVGILPGVLIEGSWNAVEDVGEAVIDAGKDVVDAVGDFVGSIFG